MPRIRLALLGLYAATLACSQPRPEARPPAAPAASAVPEASAAPSCTSVPEPDLAALQSRLLAGRFEGLDRELSAYQAAVEETPACETWAWAAFGVFLDAPAGSDRAGYARRLDEWVAEQPASFAARTARGTFYFAEGDRARGSGKVHFKNATKEMFRAMRAAHDLAQADLDEARRLHPRHVFAHTTLMQIHRSYPGGLARVEELAEEALTLAPASYQVRRVAMESLGPVWGGSFATMEAIASDALKHAAAEPRMRDLPQYTFRQRAGMASRRRDYKAALRFEDEALRYGRNQSMLESRLRYLFFSREYERVVRDAKEVLALDPRSQNAYRYRGAAHSQLDHDTAALHDLSTALEIDPRDSWTLAVRGDLYRAMEKLAEAEADLRLAVEIASNDDYAWRTLGRVLVKDHRRLDEGIECLLRATQVDSTDPENWGELGDAYYTKNNAPAARAAYEQFLEYARPDDPTIENVEKYLDGRWEAEGHPLRAWLPRRGLLQARR